MNVDHAHFADWDAAYVLGALSPADRRAFETHVEQCDLCRAAIADMAPTIGLLSRVASERAQSMLAPAPAAPTAMAEGPDAASRERVIEAGVRRSRRGRGWWIGGLTAAAAVIVAVVVIVTGAILPPAPAQVVALEPIADVPVTATVELTGVAWGTRIDMVCRYGETDGQGDEGWPYALVVTAVDGTTSEVSSWQALPGATARVSAGTALDPDEIASVEIRSVSSGKVLLRGDVPGG
ncbi:anti-sigma factor [Microbacterium sp.]|uniref:anti-sigma factor family protein n=1 Tax=Microbacterium sp. TaxID=51671 RepID=UPI0035B2733F